MTGRRGDHHTLVYDGTPPHEPELKSDDSEFLRFPEGLTVCGRSPAIRLRVDIIPLASPWLIADLPAMITATHYGRVQPMVPLLTDNASREFRRYLLSCQSNLGGCSVTVFGQATICALSNAFGATRELPCVAVEDRR
jgi:hypothetical protein